MNPVLSVYTSRRTWGELLYAVLGLPLGVAGFTFTFFTLSTSALLLITFVGLPLLAITGLLSRYAGGWIRSLGNALNRDHVPAPAPFRANPGVFGWLGSCLTDGTAWRARLYLVLKLPLGILTSVVAVMIWIYGVGGVTYPIWRPFLPCNTDANGGCHHGVGITDQYYLETPFRIVLTVLAGVRYLEG
jgi:hypothetical protein